MPMIDMAKSEKEMKKEYALNTPCTDESIYPYGLSISLSNDELDKLDMDTNCQVGDLIHMTSMAKVTSISKSETSGGENCRMELQIIAIGVTENESTEMDKPAPRRKVTASDMYKD